MVFKCTGILDCQRLYSVTQEKFPISNLRISLGFCWVFSNEMGLESWVWNTQNCVRKQDFIVYFLLKAMGSETLRVSNFSPIMGFILSFDTQDWVKYWFLEPNNVSVTKGLLCISP